MIYHLTTLYSDSVDGVGTYCGRLSYTNIQMHSFKYELVVWPLGNFFSPYINLLFHFIGR